MPNHITNCIVLKKSDWDKHSPNWKSDNRVFDFGKIILPPDDYNDEGFNWYSWNCVNWGTKWNCYESSVEIIDDEAYLRFLTAWSPPDPIMQKLVIDYQLDIKHFCFDEMCNFWGKVEIINGKGDYSWDDEAEKAEIFEMCYQSEMPDFYRADWNEDDDPVSNGSILNVA